MGDIAEKYLYPKSSEHDSLLLCYDKNCALQTNLRRFFLGVETWCEPQVTALMRHMVGASLLLMNAQFSIKEYRHSIQQMLDKGSDGFVIGTVAVHLRVNVVKEDILYWEQDRKCELQPLLIMWRNIKDFYRLFPNRVASYVDVFDLLQFVSQRVMLMSWRGKKSIDASLNEFLGIYNQLIDEVERDEKLKVKMQ
jgi:hypothetical protein